MKTHQASSTARQQPARQPLAHAIGLTLLCMAGSTAAQTTATSGAQLDTVRINVGTPAAAAEARLAEIPGSASVVTSDELDRGRNATLGDVLAFQPGVFVQTVGGNDAVKISIRGSGLVNSVGFFREGIRFSFDGLAITGAGGTSYELLNGAGTALTEVLRGGNAFDYGAVAIGGGVNFVTHSGRTAPGTRVRQEVGSWGLSKTVLSHGGVAGDIDYYVSADHYESEGYREPWSESRSSGLVANLGWRVTPKLETRLLVRFREEWHQDPGALTRSEFNQDPSLPSPAAITGKATGERPGSSWIGFKAKYKIDDSSSLEAGIARYNYRHYNSRGTTTGNPGWWNWVDINTLLRYERNDKLFGRDSRTTLSFIGTDQPLGEVDTRRGTDNSVRLRLTRFDKSYDHTFAVGNDLELPGDLWLTSGLAVVQVRRKIVSPFVLGNANPPSVDYKDTSLTPRLGLRKYLTRDLQVFGNLTRSIDAPLNWRYSNVNGTVNPLVNQRANTFEVGVKGQVGPVDGSVALYRTTIRNDLLTVVDEEQTRIQGTTVTRNFNSTTPTLRQGIELGLDARLWKSAAGEEVLLRQSYTYGDFRYRNEPRLGNNTLPGVPKHTYQAKLQYEHPQGYYAGLNVQAASKIAVDYKNTTFAPGYAVLGASFGYEAPSKGWKAYLDLKNLANRGHITAVNTFFDGTLPASARAYYTGDGFGAFAGAELRF